MSEHLRSEEELEALLAEAATRVPLGLYKHYKNGNQYLVTGYAYSRYGEEVCVLYTAQYGNYLPFVRTVTEWFKPGEGGKLRFQKI
ncbi:MAG: DUF1653 domain-containing protein [Candidatus Pacebacteria bacterium]|nr:DUF1653 domain-containing protein [Candidatus Paceibacterota bacterium]